MIYHANSNHQRVKVAILIVDRIAFKTKATTTDKEGYFIMLKESFSQEDKTIINLYKSKNRA